MRISLFIITISAIFFSGCEQKPSAQTEKGNEQDRIVDLCEKHRLAKTQCPFCDKTLIEKWGICAEHQVPEALCWKCNSILIEAFKAEGDWCAGHDMPESMCVQCNPSLAKTKIGHPADKEGAQEKGTTSSEVGNGDSKWATSSKPPFGPDSSPIKPTLDKGWCNGHGVPESVCTRCNDTLVAKFKEAGDWCKEHELPETQCAKCHPEVAALWATLKPAGKTGTDEHGTVPDAEPAEETKPGSGKPEFGPDTSPIRPTLDKGWCNGHSLPESVCTRCEGSLIQKFQDAGDWCKEHKLPETQCTKCHPEVAARWARLNPANMIDNHNSGGREATNSPSHAPERNGTARRAALLPSPTCRNSLTPVKLQSPEVVRTAGLQFKQIKEMPLTATIKRNAEVTYNLNRYARLSSRASGVVVDVLHDLGDAVTTGEPLTVIDSTELGSAKADYLQGLSSTQLWQQTAARQRSLADQGIGAKSEALEAENKLAEAQIAQSRARQRLRNLGIAEEDIESLERSQNTSSHLQLKSPFDGIIVERSAVSGEVVDTSMIVFAVANTQTMWAMIDLFEADVLDVELGQQIVFALDSLPGHTFTGKITWISAQLDPKTRTLKARAEIANETGLLRANTFGHAQIAIRHGERALFIPKEAIQWDGCCNTVFIKSNEEGTLFQPTPVRLGIDTDNDYEALSGVKAGDVLVTTGSYLLKTEILKGSIGAGCCDHVEKLDK